MKLIPVKSNMSVQFNFRLVLFLLPSKTKKYILLNKYISFKMYRFKTGLLQLRRFTRMNVTKSVVYLLEEQITQ